MFPLQITLHNPAQLNAVLAALSLGTAAAAAQTPETPAPSPAAEKVAAGKPAKAAPVPGPVTAAPAAAPEKTAAESAPAAESAAAAPQASTAVTDAGGAITYDQVAKAITERAKSDRGHVVATLEKFGAKKGTELKPEQFTEFLKALG